METKDFQALIDKNAKAEAQRAITQFKTALGKAVKELLGGEYYQFASPHRMDIGKACIAAATGDEDLPLGKWPPEIIANRKTKITEEVFSIIERIKALFESALEDREEER